ncbi:MAG TPA: hypothetical protein VFS91_00090 [Nitrobacter sp.]|nr:hypothetical protein [Nitrobacter sp.]
MSSGRGMACSFLGYWDRLAAMLGRRVRTLWNQLTDRLLARVPERHRPRVAKALAIVTTAGALAFVVFEIWRCGELIMLALMPAWKFGAEHFGRNLITGEPLPVGELAFGMAVGLAIQAWLALFLWRRYSRWRHKNRIN